MATPNPKEARRLTLVDIVMNADADVIKAAYEARLEVDKLLALREEAYRQIAALENKVEETIGQQGIFIFPVPPLAVAGLEAAQPRPRKLPKPASEAAPRTTPPEPAKHAATTPASQRTQATEEAPPVEKPHPTRAETPDRPAGRSGSNPSRPHGA